MALIVHQEQNVKTIDVERLSDFNFVVLYQSSSLNLPTHSQVWLFLQGQLNKICKTLSYCLLLVFRTSNLFLKTFFPVIIQLVNCHALNKVEIISFVVDKHSVAFLK